MSLDVADMLGPSGAIARRLGESYEARPEQAEMAASVDGALDAGSTLAVEAGTGVGKSFAYLLPAIRRIMQHKERVIVSTHTISLQEQLIEKDIPLLQAVSGGDFSAVLVKGRSNYVSVRRLALASKRQSQLFSHAAELRSLHTVEDWAYSTEDGTLSSLPQLERMGVWDKVGSDSGNCMGRKCKTYDECFYQGARRRMENGDLLVVNHALFFSDLALRAQGVGFLPPYDHVILDEAHTVEDVASDHFGIRLADAALGHLCGSLYNTRTGKGLLASIEMKDNADERLITRAIQLTDEVYGISDTFFETLARWQESSGRRNGRVDTPIEMDSDLSPMLRELSVLLRVLREKVKSEADGYELNAYQQRAEAYAGLILSWLEQDMDGAVYWLDVTPAKGRFRQRITLHCAPIDVGPILREKLFNAEASKGGRALSVVMTSATLATGAGALPIADCRLPIEEESPDAQPNRQSAIGNRKSADAFSHLRDRLGCDGASTLQLGSPFDYAANVKLIVEGGLPDPGDPRFIDAAGPAILNHIRETDGGAFVLFTAYRMLDQMAHFLRDRLREDGHQLLVQGQDGPRSILIKRFRADERSVLLGTDSFWQGVDVAGNALRNVVITKLPFAVPDRPLIEARLDRIRERGGVPFVEYQLPEAILKFKQGFGRLVRSKTDTGRVVVLDNRLRTKPYGKKFIDALPPVVVDMRRKPPGDPDELF